MTSKLCPRRLIAILIVLSIAPSASTEDSIDAKRGAKPLHIAAETGELNIVSQLLEQDMDVNIVDSSGRTPLHYACQPVRPLWEHADAMVRGGNRANRSHTNVVKYLVKKGANVNVSSHSGETPLIGAAASCDLETVKFLLEHRADVNARDKDGRTALFVISGHSWHMRDSETRQTVVKTLLQHGADPLLFSSWSSPLHMAALRGYAGIVSLFLNRGIDPNLKRKDGKTPLTLALEGNDLYSRANPPRVGMNHERTIELFRKNGAK